MDSQLSLPEITAFLKQAEEVLTDLKDSNDPKNKFIADGILKKIQIKSKKDKLPVESGEPISDKNFLNDIAQLGDHMMKLDIREKEEKKTENNLPSQQEIDKSMSFNIDFEIVNGYLDKLKEHNQKQEAIEEKSRMEEDIYISGLEPAFNEKLFDQIKDDKKKRVLEFLRNFANQLDTIKLDHADEMAQESTEVADMIEGKISIPKNHTIGLVDTIDENINEVFLTYGAKENFPERVKEFGNVLRALLKIGKIRLHDAKIMAITDDLKSHLNTKEKQLKSQNLINLNENPTFYDLTDKDKDKLDLTNVMKKLASQILPPRRGEIISPEVSRDFDMDFMGYEDGFGNFINKQPTLAESGYFTSSPKFIKDPNMIDSDDEILLNNSGKDKARMILEDHIKKIKNLLGKAEELFPKLQSLQKETSIPNQQKVDLAKAACDIVQGYGECEQYLPSYTTQYKVAKGENSSFGMNPSPSP